MHDQTLRHLEEFLNECLTGDALDDEVLTIGELANLLIDLREWCAQRAVPLREYRACARTITRCVLFEGDINPVVGARLQQRLSSILGFDLCPH